MFQPVRKRKILFRWIWASCMILVIPVICILINYVYTKSLLIGKINESNQAILENIRYSIDAKLSSAIELAEYVILDSDFKALTLTNLSRGEFLNYVEKCQKNLNSYRYINSNIDVLLYTPYYDYIISVATANSSRYIYNTLASMQSMNLSQEEWLGLLKAPYFTSSCFISDQYSYSNYGKDSIVYGFTNRLSKSYSTACNIFVSITCEFLQNTASDGLFVIADGDRILKTFGNRKAVEEFSAPQFEKAFWQMPEGEDYFEYSTGSQNYICSYAKSAAVGWTYYFCTPSQLYLQEATAIRNATWAALCATVILGLFFTILLQNRNYKPLKQLVSMVAGLPPSPAVNEFELLEKHYRTLYQENNRIRSSAFRQAEYMKRMFLLSKLKGERFALDEETVRKQMGLIMEQTACILISVGFYTQEEGMEAYVPDDRELLFFAVRNVMEELFTGERFEATEDGGFCIYLFLLREKMSRQKWREGGDCVQRLLRLDSFFREKMRLKLIISVGEVYEDFDETLPYYKRLELLREYQRLSGRCGVMLASQLEKTDVETVEKYLGFYREIDRCIAAKDYSQAFYAMEKLQECDDSIKTDSRISLGLARQINQYVEEHYMDENMNISNIAEVIGLTPKYMAKVYKDTTHISLLSYISEVRIRHAVILLRTTSLPVEEIAIRTGFNNSRSFRRNFVKVTGKTPRDFRNT